MCLHVVQVKYYHPVDLLVCTSIHDCTGRPSVHQLISVYSTWYSTKCKPVGLWIPAISLTFTEFGNSATLVAISEVTSTLPGTLPESYSIILPWHIPHSTHAVQSTIQGRSKTYRHSIPLKRSCSANDRRTTHYYMCYWMNNISCVLKESFTQTKKSIYFAINRENSVVGD